MARVNIIANRGSNRLEGVAELKANLLELGDVVATKVGRTADRKAAQAFAAELRQTAPFDANRRPGKGRDYGHLRDNIVVRLAKAKQPYVITYNVGTGDAFWSYFLEFGTRKQPANPFMRRAFDTQVARLQQIQIDELRSGIERAAKRLKVTLS